MKERIIMRLSYKSWTIRFICSFFTIVIVVISANWIIDPMMCFNHPVPKITAWRVFFNARQQKTNFLFFRKPYVETLIMGTSHMMYGNPSIWGSSPFNCAVPGLMPIEYNILLTNMTMATGRKPKKIILGVDFLCCSKTFEEEWSEYIEAGRKAFSTMVSPGYRLSSLLNETAFRQALKTIEYRGGPTQEHGALCEYSVDMQGNITSLQAEEQILREKTTSIVKEGAWRYASMEYDTDMKNKLILFKQNTASSDLIVLNTPMGTPLIRELAKSQNGISYHEKFLRDCVDVFGGIWDFMYVNSVTSNPKQWIEPSHHLPQVQELMRDRIYGIGNPPHDFGVYVTKDNIDEHVKMVKKQMLSLINEKDDWDKLLSGQD